MYKGNQIKKTKWLSVTKLKTEYTFDKDGYEVRLAGFEAYKKDLERLGLTMSDVEGFLEDNKERVYSHFMLGERHRDRKLNSALYGLIFKLTDKFYGKFGVKLWIDKEVLQKATY